MYEMIEADNAWDMSQARMLYEAAVPDMEKKPFRLFIDKRMLNKLEVKVLRMKRDFLQDSSSRSFMQTYFL